MTKEFDVIIFGASGATGKMVVAEMASNAGQQQIKWAVAGRDRHKVQQALIETQKTGSENTKDVKIFETDVTDQTSLELMCQSTKLVINCVGPYEKYGEPVIAACLKSRTHIIDMTVEIVFLHRMILKYYHEAESQGVYIVSACGIGYLYFDMAIAMLQQNFEGDISEIDLYVKPSVKPRSVHFATWESVINMTDGISTVVATRQEVYSEILKKTRSKWSFLPLSYPIKFPNGIKGVGIRLPSILLVAELGLDMKMDAVKEKPIKVNSYCIVDSFSLLIQMVFAIFIVTCLIPFSCGRRLLIKYAGLFSCGTVSKSILSEEKENSATVDITVTARGRSRKREETESSAGNPEKTVLLYGSGPPAYRNTAICLVQAAITVLQETDRLPNRGGIYTPLAAFSHTSLPSRLQKHEISYQIK